MSWLSFILRSKKKLKQYELTDESSEERQISALLRYFFKIDPDLLSDDEFYMRWGELKWCLKKFDKMK